MKTKKNAPHRDGARADKHVKNNANRREVVIPLRRPTVPETISQIVERGYPRCSCGLSVGPCLECPTWVKIGRALLAGRISEARRLLLEVTQ